MDSLLYWERDLPFPSSLPNELRRWKVTWQHHSDITKVPNTFHLALTACDSDSFPNIHKLLVIACTLPITSAEAERTFSLLRRIKTHLRSTMTEERMSDLGVIAMHYKERIPFNDIFDAFIQAQPRRLFQTD